MIPSRTNRSRPNVRLLHIVKSRSGSCYRLEARLDFLLTRYVLVSSTHCRSFALWEPLTTGIRKIYRSKSTLGAHSLTLQEATWHTSSLYSFSPYTGLIASHEVETIRPLPGEGVAEWLMSRLLGWTSRHGQAHGQGQAHPYPYPYPCPAPISRVEELEQRLRADSGGNNQEAHMQLLRLERERERVESILSGRRRDF
jgi:hypothetical protein